MVDRLERDGLLSGKPSTLDPRAMRIQLTESGKAVFEQSRRVLSGLGQYEGQLKHLRGQAGD